MQGRGLAMVAAPCFGYRMIKDAGGLGRKGLLDRTQTCSHLPRHETTITVPELIVNLGCPLK